MPRYPDEDAAYLAYRQGKVPCDYCETYFFAGESPPHPQLCEDCALLAKKSPRFAEKLLDSYGLLPSLAEALTDFYSPDLPQDERLRRFFADWQTELAAGGKGTDFVFAVWEELTSR